MNRLLDGALLLPGDLFCVGPLFPARVEVQLPGVFVEAITKVVIQDDSLT